MSKESVAAALAANAASNAAASQELQSILYPNGAGAAGESSEGGDAAAEADGADDDDDDDEEKPAADPDDDGDDEDGEAPAKGKAKADTADDDDDDDEAADDADKTKSKKSDDDDDAAGDDQGDEAPDDDGEKALRAKAKFTPEQQKVVDKLLGRKTEAQRTLRTDKEKLERRATLLEQENDQLKQGLPAPIASLDNPLADASTEAEIAKRAKNASDIRYWLMRNRDGGDMPDGKGGKIAVSPERRDELLAETDELLMVHVPARRQFVQQQRLFEVEARKAHPDLKEAKSELSLRVDAALRAYPALQSMPEARLFLADALAHRESRAKGSAAARAAAGADGAPAGERRDQSRQAAPRTEGAPRVAARTDPNRKRAAGAHERLEKTGRDDGNIALAQLIQIPR